MKLTLAKPVAVGSETVTELNFREAVVAGDLRGIKMRSLADMTVDDVLKIGGRLCAQPDPVMNALCMDDVAELFKLVNDFLSGGQKTGTGSSQ
jgi:Phage tail assembly chaperone proteins, E, or 41 or 14